MKQQGSLITTLLVILESIAVVGFLFLIFAVSSSSNIGKHEYRFQIKSNQEDLRPLAKAVISAGNQEKQLSFHTDDQGISHFRTRHPLESVTVSATNHFTQSFFVAAPVDATVNENTLLLKTVDKETTDALTQTIKTVAVIDEQQQSIPNALVTLISEAPAQSFQYDLTQEAYPLLITDLNQTIRFSVSAPGFVSQFNVSYDETSPLVVLQKQPNLNFPYEFKVSVYDANKNAVFSALDEIEIATDATQEEAKKALDTASLFVDQGAVIKNALGSFQIFSRNSENIVEIHAPQYVSQNLTLIHDGQEDNHYRVFLKKDSALFIHKMIIKTHHNNSPISAQLQTDANAAIQKEAVGVYQIHTSEAEFELNIEAAGYLPQQIRLSPEEQMSYQVAMQPLARRTYSVQVIGHEDQPIVGAVVTILGKSPQTTRTNEDGIAILNASDQASKALLAAPGYVTQTVELPSAEAQEDTLSARYQLKVNPMSDMAHTIRVNVVNQAGQLLNANVSGSAGFVSQEKAGVFKILSPTRDLKINVSATGFQPQTVTLPKSKNSLIIKLKEVDQRIHQMSDATHTIKIKVLDEKGKPLGAAVASSAGFVTQGRNGSYKIFSPTYDMQIKVSAPGYEHHTISLSPKKPQNDLTVALRKTEKGVVLNTDVGDRLILSKGVVYRVIQPIDKKTVKVFRRTDPNKGEFNDYPEGQIISLAEFNREIELEKSRKNFFDDNVWVTVYALDRNEYFLFKNVYRKQWSDYKLVYANHR